MKPTSNINLHRRVNNVIKILNSYSRLEQEEIMKFYSLHSIFSNHPFPTINLSIIPSESEVNEKAFDCNEFLSNLQVDFRKLVDINSDFIDYFSNTSSLIPIEIAYFGYVYTSIFVFPNREKLFSFFKSYLKCKINEFHDSPIIHNIFVDLYSEILNNFDIELYKTIHESLLVFFATYPITTDVTTLIISNFELLVKYEPISSQSKITGPFFLTIVLLIRRNAKIFDHKTISILLHLIEVPLLKLDTFVLSIFPYISLLLPESQLQDYISSFLTCYTHLIGLNDPYITLPPIDKHFEFLPQDLEQVESFCNGINFDFSPSFPKDNPLLVSRHDLSEISGSLIMTFESHHDLGIQFMNDFCSTINSMINDIRFHDFLASYFLFFDSLHKIVNLPLPKIIFHPNYSSFNLSDSYSGFFSLRVFIVQIFIQSPDAKKFSSLLTSSNLLENPYLESEIIEITILQSNDLFKHQIENKYFLQALAYLLNYYQNSELTLCRVLSVRKQSNSETTNEDISQFIKKKNEIEMVRTSLFRLLKIIFSPFDYRYLFQYLSNSMFVLPFLSHLKEDNLKDFIFSIIKIGLNNFDIRKSLLQSLLTTINSQINENILLDLVNVLDGSLKLFGVVSDYNIFANSFIVFLGNQRNESKYLKDLFHSIMTFLFDLTLYNHNMPNPFQFNASSIQPIQSALKLISDRGDPEYEFLLTVLAGHQINLEDEPFFEIHNPFILNVIFNSFDLTIQKRIVKLVGCLCNYSLTNIIQVHDSGFDSFLLKTLIKTREQNDNDSKEFRTLSLSTLKTIFDYSSSPDIVQDFIALLQPVDEKYVCDSQLEFLPYLGDIFSRRCINPYAFSSLSDSFIISKIPLEEKGKFLFNAWVWIQSEKPSSLIKITSPKQTNFHFEVLISTKCLFINGIEFSCSELQSLKEKWFSLSLLIDNSNIEVFIDRESVEDLFIPNVFFKTQLDQVEINQSSMNLLDYQVTIGGTKGIIANIATFGFYSNAKKEDIYHIVENGSRVSKKQLQSYNPFYLSCKTKQQSIHSFADCFTSVFGVEILLPLLAQLSLTTRNNQPLPHLTQLVIQIIKDALLISKEQQVIFRKSSGVKVMCHLLMQAKSSEITYDLYEQLYQTYVQISDIELKLEFVHYLLANFILWIFAEPLDHIRIVENCVSLLFPLHPDFFQNEFGISKLLNYLSRLYYYGKPPEDERPRNPSFTTEDISKCRSVINNMISKMQINQTDYETLISLTINSSEETEKISLLTLLEEIHCPNESEKSVLRLILKFPQKSPKVQLQILLVLIHVLTNYPKLFSIAVEIIYHEYYQSEIPIPEEVITFLQNYRNPFLFPLLSYSCMVTKNTDIFSQLEPSSSYKTSIIWDEIAIKAAIDFNDQRSIQIYTFLLKCEDNWENIYNKMDIRCKIEKIPKFSVFSLFFSALFNNETSHNEPHCSQIIKLVQRFFFYSDPFIYMPSLSTFFKEYDTNQEESSNSDIQKVLFWKSIYSKTDPIYENMITQSNMVFLPEFDQNMHFIKCDVAQQYFSWFSSKDMLQLSIAILLSSFSSSLLGIDSKLLKSNQTYPFYEKSYQNNNNIHSFEAFKVLENFAHQNSDFIHNPCQKFQNQILDFSFLCFEVANQTYSFLNGDEIDQYISTEFQSSSSFDQFNFSKIWYHLYANMTADRAPWDPRQISSTKSQKHWMIEMRACSSFCIMKMKPNKCYTDHIHASVMRDCGSHKAADQFLNELQKKKAEELKSKGIPILFDLTKDDNEEITQTPESEIDNTQKQKSLVLDCLLIKRNIERTAQMILSKKNIQVRLTGHNSSQNSVTISSSNYPDLIGMPKSNEKKKLYFIYPEEIRHILQRRRMLKPTSIEIFLTNGKSFLLNFLTISNTYVIDQIYHRYNLPNIIYLQRSPPLQFFAQHKFEKMWAAGEISNFQYLILLNEFSGRTFTDVSNYPFFPWVLSNYSSEELDLSDPNNYRDLSKPVGALNFQRLSTIKEQSEEMTLFRECSYLYSSYSICPLSLYLWMIRIEPYTSLHIHMQSGKFDNPSRIFSSIANTWNLVTNNMNDYRELIPEFYFMPEFLVNSNHFDFGKTHDSPVDDVILPPWAKESPIRFIYIMRKALESDYVSQHLNEWIDLVWGVKSRGIEALKSDNTFFPELYETIWESSHAKERKLEIEGSLYHVGSIPSQLFSAPHLKRKVTPMTPFISQNIEFNLAKPDEKRNFVINYAQIQNDSKRTNLVTIFYPNYNSSTIEAISINFKKIPLKFSKNLTFLTLPTSFNSKSLISFLVQPSLNQCYVLNKEFNEFFKFSNQKDIPIKEIDRQVIAYDYDQNVLAYITPSDLNICVNETLSVSNNILIRFYGEGLLCLAINSSFGVAVVGTRSGTIVINSLFEGTKTNVIPLDGLIPQKVLITNSMGFIITYAIKEKNEDQENEEHYFLVFNINGELISKKKTVFRVVAWDTFVTLKDFDFVIYADEKKRIFAFNPFEPEEEMDLFKDFAFNDAVISLKHFIELGVIVCVFSSGKCILIPHIFEI